MACLVACCTGCQTAKWAFESIQLGKPIDYTFASLIAKETRNGASYEDMQLSILPIGFRTEAVHVLKDDTGVVVAKSYFRRSFTLLIPLSMYVRERYIVEVEIPEEYYAEPAEGWDGAKLFESAFPLGLTSTAEGMLQTETGSESNGQAAEDAPGIEAYLTPAEVAHSYADAEADIWRHMELAASQDETGQVPRPEKNIPTRLMMTLAMLKTLGANRSRRQAPDAFMTMILSPMAGVAETFAAVRPWKGPPEPRKVVIFDELYRAEEGDGINRDVARVEHRDGRRIRLELDKRAAAGALAVILIGKRPPPRPTMQPAQEDTDSQDGS
jgi:hypothetical protein